MTKHEVETIWNTFNSLIYNNVNIKIPFLENCTLNYSVFLRFIKYPNNGVSEMFAAFFSIVFII